MAHAGLLHVARLARHAEAVLDLARGSYGDDYFSLPLCVIDAVFSIGVRYKAVRNVIGRYCTETGLPRFRAHRSELPDKWQQESVSNFCERLRGWGTHDRVAAKLGSRQRTSTHPTSSILKAEATLRFADQLRAHRIEYLQTAFGVPPTVNSCPALPVIQSRTHLAMRAQDRPPVLPEQ